LNELGLPAGCGTAIYSDDVTAVTLPPPYRPTGSEFLPLPQIRLIDCIYSAVLRPTTAYSISQSVSQLERLHEQQQ